MEVVVTTAPVKWSPPTNQHPVFDRPDALPVVQPTVSKHWTENTTATGYVMFSLAIVSWFVKQRSYAKTTRSIFTKFNGKVAHGPLKKPLDLVVIWIKLCLGCFQTGACWRSYKAENGWTASTVRRQNRDQLVQTRMLVVSQQRSHKAIGNGKSIWPEEVLFHQSQKVFL